jgi:hypothetical protein
VSVPLVSSLSDSENRIYRVSVFDSGVMAYCAGTKLLPGAGLARAVLR